MNKNNRINVNLNADKKCYSFYFYIENTLTLLIMYYILYKFKNEY